MIPFFGNVISLKLDGSGFMRRIGTYLGKPVSTRVSFLGFEIFVFQDRNAVKELVREHNLSSIVAFSCVLPLLFGMSKRTLPVYRQDDSGPLARPYFGSNVMPENRIHHILRRGFLQSMSVRTREAAAEKGLDEIREDWGPFGKSELIGYRHQALKEAGHDDDISATDLGLLWTYANTLVVLAVFHIFRDPSLLQRVRKEVCGITGYRPVEPTDAKCLAKSPLLSSIYAETLRLYVRVFFIFSSSQMDLQFDKWHFPKDNPI
ncbi:hypothetical protein F5Y19DRAFT_469467 [Xylariaceae sp. FL1651]|nr:hypothetical protein F5Y19DRAFT_469467 [Xylariaceae sp. FL1651]